MVIKFATFILKLIKNRLTFLEILIYNEFKQYKDKNQRNFLDVFLDITKIKKSRA